MNKILTIIIPTYNMEKYLRKCLNSLIVSEDNMQRLEVLVVNDGSKDSSSQIAHEYEAKYPQTFRVIDKENGNYGSCVNRGLKEATGKYVKVLDADDYFDTTVFGDFIGYLYICDDDMVLSDFCIVDESYTISKMIKMIDRVQPYLSIPIKNKYVHLQMHQVTYKTENLRRIKYKQTEGVSYTDREWVFWPITSVNSFCYVPLCLYCYLVGRAGQTMDVDVHVKAVSQEITITLNMIDLWSKHRNYLGDAEFYINNSICERMKYLIVGDALKFKSVNQNLFIDMDKRIRKDYPEFYEYSSEHTYLGAHCPYKFLKHWRKKYRLLDKDPIVKLYMLLKR